MVGPLTMGQLDNSRLVELFERVQSTTIDAKFWGVGGWCGNAAENLPFPVELCNRLGITIQKTKRHQMNQVSSTQTMFPHKNVTISNAVEQTFDQNASTT